MRFARFRLGWLSMVAVAVGLLPMGCGSAGDGGPEPGAGRPLGAGFRFSAYGPQRDPGPEYWLRVGQEMASRFDGAVPETIWIVGRLRGDGTELNFPAEPSSPLITAVPEDHNQAALDLFDRNGFRVWLQVEPGHAPVAELIHLVLGRYGSHPSVAGFGIDVEWYQSTERPEGKPVTDEEAAAWLAAIRSHDPRYRLFLKHWEQSKLPPTLRDGLLFVDDSQILPSLDAMVEEFAAWGRSFVPAPVAFQFGYPSDRPWWRQLADPPGDIGRAILAAVPNAAGLYWVDFTVLDVFPPGPDAGFVAAGAASPANGYDPTPRPIVGVKIYDFDGDLGELFAGWRELGVTHVFASEQLASREGFRELARQAGIQIYVIFPVLYAPEALAADPSLSAVTADGKPAKDDWVEFACPSRDELRQRRVDEAVALVQKLRPDGLSLDFIRDFVFWEEVRPDADPARLPDACYCPKCLRRFAATLAPGSQLPVDDPVAAAAWIRTNAAAEWTAFKEDTISSLAWQIIQAAKAVKSNLRVNLHVVPWRTGDFEGAIGRIAGQDRAALGHLADYLSPMCYAHMLYRPPEWIASVVRDVAEAGRCPVLPSIQVAAAYRDEALSVDELEAGLRAALEPPSAGVVFWQWDHIAADPAKAEVIRRVLREPR
ncbi:MAG TPA: hypothetical protein PKJ99_05290 [Thermoanaerobaculales bacterium]|nr:hypothetical protein [Thermoanaerobaculales bacterium]HQL31458.1 hypothetical protein [Thermoanaerobaculales bacterium]